MFRLLQGRNLDQIVVRCGAAEIHVQVIGRELRQNVAILELDGAVILEVHDQRAIQLTAGRNTKILREVCDGAYSFQRNDLGAVHVAALADLIGDAAYFQRMRACVAVGDEASDPSNTHQYAFVAQLAQRAVGRHPRYAKGSDQVVFGGHPSGRTPLAGTDVVENMTLDLQVKGLQGRPVIATPLLAGAASY